MTGVEQLAAEVPEAQKRRALEVILALQARRPASEHPPYAHAAALFSHAFLGVPPPQEAERDVRLLSALILARTAATLEADQLPGCAALCLAVAQSLQPVTDTLYKLRELLAQARVPKDQAAVLRRLLSCERDLARRKELWLGLTRLLEEDLAAHEEAAEAYGAAFAELPDALELLSGRARCLEALRRYDELLAVIELQIAREATPTRLGLLHTRMASLLTSVVRDETRAIAHYRQALRWTPTFEPPLQGLLAIAERRADWATVAETLKLRLRNETRPRERANLLARLGEVVANGLEDRARAIAYLERAVREYPRGLAARLKLLEVLIDAGEYERAESYASPPDSSDLQALDPDELARLSQLAARVAFERGRAAEAVRCLGLALELTTRPLEVLRQLLSVLERAEPECAPPAILHRLGLEWERGGQPELASLAAIAEGRLLHLDGRTEQAQLQLSRACTLQPGSALAWEALARHHAEARDFRRAAQAYLAASGAEKPPDPRLLLAAAQIVSDHLGDPAGALELLLGRHRRAHASAESALFAAALALRLGRFAEAEESLSIAAARLPPDHPRLLGLRLALLRTLAGPSSQLDEARAQAARAGDERAFRELASQHALRGELDALDALAAAVPAPVQPAAWSHAGDALRLSGHAARAYRCYRKAVELSDGQALEAVEALSIAAPAEAIYWLERLLLRSPFHPRALTLLSSLIVAAGESDRALMLYRLSTALIAGPQPPPPVRVEAFGRTPPSDPLLCALPVLQATLPDAVLGHSSAYLRRAEPVELPSEVRAIYEAAARLHGVAPPRVLVNPELGAEPVVLPEGPLLLVSPRLLDAEMPQGALIFTLLRGLYVHLYGLSLIGLLTPERLDAVANALRLAAAPPPDLQDEQSPSQLLAAALDVPKESCAIALEHLRLVPGLAHAEPQTARAAYASASLKAALDATGDLVCALAALSLLAPPGIAFQSTRVRWLKRLGELPAARAAVGYTLAEHAVRLARPTARKT